MRKARRQEAWKFRSAGFSPLQLPPVYVTPIGPGAFSTRTLRQRERRAPPRCLHLQVFTLQCKVTGMETKLAAENLQVIRTLMERSAVYRRALAPITLLTGAIGVLAAGIGLHFQVESPRSFAFLWLRSPAAARAGGAFLS